MCTSRPCYEARHAILYGLAPMRAARRLLGSLSPEALEGMNRHGNKVSLFESIEQYLDKVEERDADREEAPKEELN